MPLWAKIVMLVILYHVIAWPLHVVAHGPFRRWRGPAHAWLSVWSGILWIGFTWMFLWLAYQYFPGVQQFIDGLPDSLKQATIDVLVERP
jgi:hypothetical protein